MGVRFLAICFLAITHVAGCIYPAEKIQSPVPVEIKGDTDDEHVRNAIATEYLTAANSTTSDLIQIEITTARTHLGHNLPKSISETVWCDGCYARLLPSQEEFVIYWINYNFGDTSFRFENGQRYDVSFLGPIESSVMAFKGKCINWRNITRVKRLPTKND